VGKTYNHARGRRIRKRHRSSTWWWSTSQPAWPRRNRGSLLLGLEQIPYLEVKYRGRTGATSISTPPVAASRVLLVLTSRAQHSRRRRTPAAPPKRWQMTAKSLLDPGIAVLYDGQTHAQSLKPDRHRPTRHHRLAHAVERCRTRWFDKATRWCFIDTLRALTSCSSARGAAGLLGPSRRAALSSVFFRKGNLIALARAGARTTRRPRRPGYSRIPRVLATTRVVHAATGRLRARPANKYSTCNKYSTIIQHEDQGLKRAIGCAVKTNKNVRQNNRLQKPDVLCNHLRMPSTKLDSNMCHTEK